MSDFGFRERRSRRHPKSEIRNPSFTLLLAGQSADQLRHEETSFPGYRQPHPTSACVWNGGLPLRAAVPRVHSFRPWEGAELLLPGGAEIRRDDPGARETHGGFRRGEPGNRTGRKAESVDNAAGAVLDAERRQRSPGIPAGRAGAPDLWRPG